MADPIFGQLLELVRRPMPEIQRPGGPELERISGGGDVIEMQLGAAINQPFHGSRLEVVQCASIAFKGFKKNLVANERHLDRLNITGALVAGRKGGEQLKIIDHCERRAEGADEILFPKGV